MLAFPYTKRHCTQWNVNHGVAIIVCSAAKAEQLGLRPQRGWIFPVAAAESKHVVVLAQQRRLHRHPGTVLCGERALALAGIATSGPDGRGALQLLPGRHPIVRAATCGWRACARSR